MSVNLEVGMTAIRRDGERVGPCSAVRPDGRARFGDNLYSADGKYWSSFINAYEYDLIEAGYPWATLGAQVGDTVRRVWNGVLGKLDEHEFVEGQNGAYRHPDSLYVIVARAAKPAAVTDPHKLIFSAGPQKCGLTPKPADRPRAAHRLNLQEGDVVELVAWQDGQTRLVGVKYRKAGAWLYEIDGLGGWLIEQTYPKGHRPLFRVISRAAEQKPDEVIVLTGWLEKAGWILGYSPCTCDTHRFTLTFPAGGNTGTVTREAL